MAKLAKTVCVFKSGEPFWFDVGSTPPKWAADKIKNPKAWDTPPRATTSAKEKAAADAAAKEAEEKAAADAAAKEAEEKAAADAAAKPKTSK